MIITVPAKKRFMRIMSITRSDGKFVPKAGANILVAGEPAIRLVPSDTLGITHNVDLDISSWHLFELLVKSFFLKKYKIGEEYENLHN